MQTPESAARGRVSPASDARTVVRAGSPVSRAQAALAYRLCFRPRAGVILSARCHWKLENRAVLRGFRHRGIFLYGNLTETPLDAFVPARLTRKRLLLPAPRTAFIARKKPLGTRSLILDTPETPADYRPFLERIEKHTVKQGAVVIYPTDSSDAPFLYPVRFDEASFAFTTVLSADARGRVRAVTYLDGPFYPNTEIPRRDRTAELGERIRAAMESHLGAEPEKGGAAP